MKKLILIITATLLLTVRASADEGMWLLPMLGKMNIEDMQAKGFKLTAEDIYNVNGNAIKDAIVIFGGGCTGEIVSPDGLLFTNHHCGYSNIQSLSSVEHDYLKNGFWAMNRGEELPAPGLAVRFIRHIDDVTENVLNGTTDDMPENERQAIIKENTDLLIAALRAQYDGMDILVRDFFGGNQYMMFAMEVYRDVRLVGAPPASIGKFGGETDNWMWPRHTGDFSIFRVYADENGRPAEYSPENVPYKAPVHLKISLKGYEEGDFAMIMGFPGGTDRYMTSYEIDQVLEVDNPTRIYIRGVRQGVLREYMEGSDLINIQYANKYANSSNYWKNSIGMSRGLKNLNVKAKKEAQQAEFTRWIAADPSRARYADALPLIEEAVRERIPYSRTVQYLRESVLTPVEIVQISGLSRSLADEEMERDVVLPKVLEAAEGFYKDYNEQVDRHVAKVMLKIFFDSMPETVVTPEFREKYIGRFNGDIDKYVDYLYDNSVFANEDKFRNYVLAGNFSGILEDPAAVLMEDVIEMYQENYLLLQAYNEKFERGHRLFIAGLLEMEPDKMHYPDANFTIRLTYGNILPYSPADAVIYDYYTTLTGVLAKEDPTNPMEFTVPDKLKELYYAKDFGQYEYNGNVPVGFLSNNDITGGNSGSPIMNAYGELIGLAFDGNWEAMSGDIAFEPELQRTINVDVRYVLFIVDKFAGAGYLLDEMTIVR